MTDFFRHHKKYFLRYLFKVAMIYTLAKTYRKGMRLEFQHYDPVAIYVVQKNQLFFTNEERAKTWYLGLMHKNILRGAHYT